MYTRRPFYHPYRPSSAPLSPAGFRIADYMKPKRCFNFFQRSNFTNTHSPAPSPSTSPLKSQHHPQDDAPSTIRLADFLAGNGFGTPQRPSTPTPDHPRNTAPDAQKANAPTQGPPFIPPRKKAKYGPKHLRLSSSAIRPGLVPPRRRAQQLKEKRDTARKRILDRHERRVLRAREGISNLQREAETLMTPQHMNAQDKIFLKQLRALKIDQSFEHDLEQCRQQMSRAADESTKRQQEHQERDEEAAKTWGECQDEEAREEQKKKVEAFVWATEEKSHGRRRRNEEAALRADEERQCAHEAQERKIREEQEHLFRRELARKAEKEERQRREEQERRMQEERERWLREERERRLQEERERRLREERERRMQEERERMLREEIERLRREARERYLREERERLAREEQERQARLLAEQATQAERVRQHFIMYESKWNELRTSKTIPPVDVQEMPWPVFSVVSSADQITFQDVQTFLFHPQRPGTEGKTARDKVKSELLRFHPDKFNARIVPKIVPSQRAVAQEIAGTVVRILTNIMTKEVEQQK